VASPYLLVDETDGRILAEVSAEEALQLLGELEPSQGLCLVKLESGGGGGFVHTDSSIAVRPLHPSAPRRPLSGGLDDS
jgi:hypothetical protein